MARGVILCAGLRPPPIPTSVRRALASIEPGDCRAAGRPNWGEAGTHTGRSVSSRGTASKWRRFEDGQSRARVTCHSTAGGAHLQLGRRRCGDRPGSSLRWARIRDGNGLRAGRGNSGSMKRCMRRASIRSTRGFRAWPPRSPRTTGAPPAITAQPSADRCRTTGLPMFSGLPTVLGCRIPTRVFAACAERAHAGIRSPREGLAMNDGTVLGHRARLHQRARRPLLRRIKQDGPYAVN